uniref:SprT-like domain-containing protein n=1 Tax=Caenorhabditis tropicalis TaxID=1561998 RepID=A0A1I7TER3_9PELO
MPSPFRELHNNSNASVSSYETAWSTSFANRRSTDNDSSLNLKQIKNEPISDLDESISNLENNISMMSVSSPISPAYHTPARKTVREAPMTPGERLLQTIEKEQDKILLRQLYPEMFEDSVPPQKPNKKLEKEVKIEPDDGLNEKENLAPGGWIKEEPKEVKKPRSKKIVVSSDDEEDNKEFDKYIKKLRGQPEEPKKAVRKERKRNDDFVVEDDYVSEESSEDDEEDESYFEDEEEELHQEVEKKEKKKRPSDDEEWFLLSLSENFSGPIHENAKVYVKENALRMKKHRESLLIHLQEILVRRIFFTIPEEKLKVIWNARLRKSAGQCRNHSNGTSTVEMSPVVCTTAERVRDTLIHEMCHAAVWVVDRLHKEGHGPGWKKWGARCSSTFKALPFIERCHSYEIEAKFFYVCENDNCTVEIKRQSKSLDTSRKACGRCHGRFILYRFCRRTNTRIRIEDPKLTAKSHLASQMKSPSPPPPRRLPSKDLEGFQEYSESRYWDLSAEGLKHSEVMERLRKEFKELNKSS